MISRKILDKRIACRQQSIEAAKEYGKNIKNILGDAIVIIIGSIAKGDFNEASDIDVLVISDALPKNPLQRFEVLYLVAKGNIEPKGYTRQEFDTMIAKQNPMAVDAVKNGIVVT